jgi:hypothetical protein
MRSLDSGRISTALASVTQADPGLAADLGRNIGAFQYTAILDALQSADTASASNEADAADMTEVTEVTDVTEVTEVTEVTDVAGGG